MPSMNEQTQPERVPLGELYRKAETDQEEQETKQERSSVTEKLSRLEKLERQKSQLEAKIKAIHARENEKVRRARTRRLIQIGAIACKYLNCPDDISPSDFEAFVKSMVEQPEVKRYLEH
jgi:hypothetical protein